MTGTADPIPLAIVRSLGVVVASAYERSAKRVGGTPPHRQRDGDALGGRG